jgi:hypothetical protein
LLLVVAFSDLEGGDKKLSESTLNEREAAAVGGEVTTALTPRRRAARQGESAGRRLEVN